MEVNVKVQIFSLKETLSTHVQTRWRLQDKRKSSFVAEQEKVRKVENGVCKCNHVRLGLRMGNPLQWCKRVRSIVKELFYCFAYCLRLLEHWQMANFTSHGSSCLRGCSKHEVGLRDHS